MNPINPLGVIHSCGSTRMGHPQLVGVEPQLWVTPGTAESFGAHFLQIFACGGTYGNIVGAIYNHIGAQQTMPQSLDCVIIHLVEKLKKASSKWMKTKGSTFSNFYWQSGYGVFSVSSTHLDDVIRYVACQKEHHKASSFQQEYLRILKKYGIDYDERYVWD